MTERARPRSTIRRAPCGLWLLLPSLAAACGDDATSPARLGPVEVQYGTDRGLFDLSLARDGASGLTVVSWTEGDFAQGDPAWLALGSVEVRRAFFDPPEVGRVLRRWGPLLATGDGFVRWEARFAAQGTWLLSELRLDPAGEFVEFRQRSSDAVRLLTKLETVAVAGRAIVLGVDADLRIIAEVRTPGAAEGADTTLVVDEVAPARWAVEAAAQGDRSAVVAWVGFGDPPTQQDLRQHLAWIDGLPDEPTVSIVRGGARVPGELVELATSGEAAATLWLAPDGRLLLFVATVRGEMDLASPTWSSGDTTVQSPALLAAAGRLVVIYRAAEPRSGATRAVVVDPETGEAVGPFDWPLSAGDGPAAYGPADAGLEWAQVGPCQGEACGERWLSTGSIEL